MIIKKPRNKVIAIYEKGISNLIDETCDEINEEIEAIKTDFVKRGFFKSGPYLDKLLDFLSKKIIRSYEKSILVQKELSLNLNIKFKEKELDEIKKLLLNNYMSFADKIKIYIRGNIDSDIFNSFEDHIDRKINNVKNEINIKIEKDINEAKMTSKERKDRPEIRQAKFSNYLSIFAIIIAIISLIISISSK